MSLPLPDLQNQPIVVLLGGPSREREVSLRSGAAVANALRSLGANVTEVDVRDADFRLPPDPFLVFNLLHGTFGEDGSVQAELERRGVPYTGEGVRGSQLAFDKIASKECFARAGIPTVPWQVLSTPQDPISGSFPLVVKAPRQGSSVGVHIVHTAAELPAALADCFSLDERVLVEPFFAGRELTVGILGSEALPVVEIRPKGEFYGYENKYTKGGSEYFVPAPLDTATSDRIRATALAAHAALGLEVYSRVDIMLAPNGDLNVLEINTIPGMTETSLLPKAAAVIGLDFPALCQRIAAHSLARFS